VIEREREREMKRKRGEIRVERVSAREAILNKYPVECEMSHGQSNIDY
jgi:hypothetical protein